MQATEDDVKIFFESACGEVSLEPGNYYYMFFLSPNDNNTCSVIQVTRIRLLGDQLHSTRIAFVEFAMVSSLRFCLFFSFFTRKANKLQRLMILSYTEYVFVCFGDEI